VLCDEGLEEWIRTNDCVVWGGNIADSEAHTGTSPSNTFTDIVSNSLTCTRYPFIALIANIPSPTPSSLPQMTLLTRIEGPLPTNRLIPTLTSAVSRTRGLLAQRRAIKAEQNWSRELRRQQEEAYTNSLAADRAREEAQRRAREDAERVEQERQEQQILADIRSKNREQWRLWKTWDLKRMGLVGMKSEIGKTARVGLRLTGGERIVQIFPGEMNLAEVYSFVECYDLLFPQNQGTTLRSSMEEEVQKPVGYEHEFRFRLVVPYPRKVIDSGFTPIKNESGLWPSGSIVVEEIEEDSEEESSDEE
jgi:FAS-associated factor 2